MLCSNIDESLALYINQIHTGRIPEVITILAPVIPRLLEGCKWHNLSAKILCHRIMNGSEQSTHVYLLVEKAEVS